MAFPLAFVFPLAFARLFFLFRAVAAGGSHAVEARRLAQSHQPVELVAAGRPALVRCGAGFRRRVGGHGPEHGDDGVAGDPVRARDLRRVFGVERIAGQRLAARAAHRDHALEQLVGGQDIDGVPFQLERLCHRARAGGRRCGGGISGLPRRCAQRTRFPGRRLLAERDRFARHQLGRLGPGVAGGLLWRRGAGVRRGLVRGRLPCGFGGTVRGRLPGGGHDGCRGVLGGRIEVIGRPGQLRLGRLLVHGHDAIQHPVDHQYPDFGRGQVDLAPGEGGVTTRRDLVAVHVQIHRVAAQLVFRSVSEHARRRPPQEELAGGFPVLDGIRERAKLIVVELRVAGGQHVVRARQVDALGVDVVGDGRGVRGWRVGGRNLWFAGLGGG